jgi:hypothetical protein
MKVGWLVLQLPRFGPGCSGTASLYQHPAAYDARRLEGQDDLPVGKLLCRLI